MFAARLQREITQRWCLWYNSLVSEDTSTNERNAQQRPVYAPYSIEKDSCVCRPEVVAAIRGHSRALARRQRLRHGASRVHVFKEQAESAQRSSLRAPVREAEQEDPLRRSRDGLSEKTLNASYEDAAAVSLSCCAPRAAPSILAVARQRLQRRLSALIDCLQRCRVQPWAPKAHERHCCRACCARAHHV